MKNPSKVMISDAELRERVKELIAQSLHLKLKDVVEGVSITQKLGADSLDIIQMLAAVEKEYKIAIDDEDELPKMDTLEGIIQVVKRYIAKKEKTPHE